MNDVWWRQETPIGEITVVVGSGGVKAIGWTTEHEHSIVGRADNEAVPSIATELESWFGGRSQRFECDVDLGRVAAPFAHAALTTLRREVGWGETVTYGELAGWQENQKRRGPWEVRWHTIRCRLSCRVTV